MTVAIMDKGANQLGAKQRTNRRIVLLCGAIGGVIGAATAMAVLNQEPAAGAAHPSLLTAPLPAWLAIAVALAWGVVLPILCWRWHQVIDEHERDAYREGAVAGFYVMGVGAPVWWFLWRGGMAPAVDPLWLYVATIAVGGAVWAWRKYS